MTEPAVPPVRVYGVVFALLLALTGATVGLSYVDLGRWNLPAALLVAAVKAGLVAGTFMHLKAEKGVARLFAAAGLFWMAILLLGTLVDVFYVSTGYFFTSGTPP